MSGNTEVAVAKLRTGDVVEIARGCGSSTVTAARYSECGGCVAFYVEFDGHAIPGCGWSKPGHYGWSDVVHAMSEDSASAINARTDLFRLEVPDEW